MRKTIISALAIFLSMALSAQSVNRVEPLSWWTDMQCPLTLMLHGTNLANAEVTILEMQGKKARPTTGLILTAQHNAESNGYLFLDLDVRKPGNYLISLRKGKKTIKVPYSIGTRRQGSAERESFTTADVIYLLMPDRFADGNPANNTSSLTAEAANPASLDGRHGGDIEGIVSKLDYIRELGATTIWPTPLLLDNEPAWSYHGYACADYYHIDPRFGDNESYRRMVETAHEKGLKFIMDMVPNHCGLAHWWMQDLPFADWVHQFPEYTVTNNCFTTAYDIHASEFDRKNNESGWFDTHMPDMNLDNPYLLQYFKQWAIWWIEYANLDGLRVDTYPYNEKQPASEWCAAIRREYPNINIVGECWTRPAAAVAYWQADARNADGFNSNLPSVMDFPTEEAIRQALENNGEGWGNGLTRVYESVAQDYQYASLDHLLTFVGNHDMEHIADVVLDNDLRRVKLAITLLATMRGIPQLFAGDEYGQRSADITRGHSGLRQMLAPESKWTPEQSDLFTYQSKLFRYRLNEPILHNGKTMHFMSRDNTYAYVRYSEEGAIFCFLNAADDERTIPVAHYKEILDRFGYQGENIIDGTSVTLTDGLSVAPLSSLVVRLHK